MDFTQRLAEISDTERVREMTALFVADLVESGESLTSDAATVESIMSFVDRWIEDKDAGTVVLSTASGKPVAMVAAGSVDPGIKTNHGKCAVAMIQYVEPEFRGRGLVRGLHELEQGNLRASGFDSIVCTVRYGDEQHAEKMRRMGFSEKEVLMVRSL